MKMKSLSRTVVLLCVATLGFAQSDPLQAVPSEHLPVATQKASGRVFEIRTYTTSQKLDVFTAFFLNTTVALFKKHGFEPVGYWIPQDSPRSENIFIYMLAFKNHEAAEAQWRAFLTDPEWLRSRADFMAKHGKITDKIESQFVTAADFSPLK